MKECILISSIVEELTIILFGVNRLKNNTGVRTRGQKTGKNLVTLMALKQRIRILSSKCNMSDDEVSVEICNNSTNSSLTKTNKTTNNDTNNDCVSANKTLSDNDTICSSSKDTRTSKNINNQNKAVARNGKQTIRDKDMMNGKKLVNTNLDQLTDDVLNLPREYRPIRLAEDHTISSNAKKEKGYYKP